MSKLINKNSNRLGSIVSFIGFFFAVYATAQPAGSDIWLAKLPANTTSKNITKRSLQWKQVTNSPSYHNQPYFDLSNNRLLFSAMKNGQQTDIFEASLETLRIKNLTQSPQSEYSPTVLPDRSGLSGIKVDDQGKQWLWSWSREGVSRGKLLTAEPIGYHVWLNQTDVLVFVLQDEKQTGHTLERHSLNASNTDVFIIDQNIGASLWAIPQSQKFSYSRMRKGKHQLMSYSPSDGKVELLTDLPVTSAYYAWAPDGVAVTVSGESGNTNRLIAWDPKYTAWQPYLDMSERCHAGISRIAISHDYEYLAVVCNR